MRRVLKNDQLINGLTGKHRAVRSARRFDRRSVTVSQFRWSSSKGPPVHIQSGTLASANIQIASRRPISMCYRFSASTPDCDRLRAGSRPMQVHTCSDES